jgi:hypothetical protein
MSWDCPDCGRRFARRGQGHECAPAMTIEDYFSTGPGFERPVFDAVMAGLADAGLADAGPAATSSDPVHVEAVSVGIFLKRASTFAELRPMTKWVAVGFGLRREARHPLITRKRVAYGDRFWHVANVASAADVDEALIDLLVEAYHQAPPA